MKRIIDKIRKMRCRTWEQYAEYCNKYLKVSMGEKCTICKSVYFGSEPYLVKLGDNVRISGGVTFITHDGGVHVLRQLGYPDVDLYGPIRLGNNVFIGMRAIIMPGVSIGDNCIIGTGSIVTKDIPDNSIAVGVPAKVINNIEEYRKKNLNRMDNTHNINTSEKYKYLTKKYHLKK